ncbi:MAG: glycosyltransferase family 2 protein [Bacilli bacterium]|nr:glycosyltransferase family 2 protein [Bacilli bacterium]
MVSVIINVYNGEKYIKKCLDSVVNQTYKDLEIIIVNDGSTDKTLSICKGYKDKRIKIINQENMGLALSRNVGIDNANGDYLYFIDADDFIELDTIEYLYNLSKEYNSDFVTCKSKDIFNYEFEVTNEEEQINIITAKDMLKKVFLVEDNAVATWNKLVKKELYDDIRFENKKVNDIAITHKVIMKTDNIIYSNQIKYYYLKNDAGICRKQREDVQRNIDMYEAALERYNYINNVYPNFIENNIGILELTTRLYLRNNKKVIDVLNRKNIITIYNKLFSLKILKCKMRRNLKIRLIIFRISPKLYKFIINMYLKVKGKR